MSERDVREIEARIGTEGVLPKGTHISASASAAVSIYYNLHAYGDPGESEEDEEGGEGGGVAKEAQATERERGREKDNARGSGEPSRVYTIHASGDPGEIIFYDYGRSGAAKAGDGRRLEGVMRDFLERKRMHTKELLIFCTFSGLGVRRSGVLESTL